jgi:hypothetical protein
MLIAALSLATASAWGCNQSLFDGSSSDAIDGGSSSAVDAAESDAPPVVSECPAPCRGDAVADFDMTQGGSNGRWLYQEDSRDPGGLQYAALEVGSVGGAPAWTSATGSPSAIVNCAQSSASVCEGVGNHLVFIPSPVGAADSDPHLAYQVPSDGTYIFSGQARSPDGAVTDLLQRFLFVRNARHDLLHSQSFVTSTSDETFTLTVEALEGDHISLTLLPNESGTPEPVAFQLYVTLVADGDEAFPGNCQFAATFDGASPLTDRCRQSAIDDLNDNIGPSGTSVDTASANGHYDRARKLDEGQYLRSLGAPADYSADFTVQFWVNLDEPQPSFGATAYADWNDAARGGVNISFSQDSSIMDACYIWDDPAVPDPAPGGCLRGTAPRDGEWHFYRLRRNATNITLCIDGVLQDQDAGPGSFDMSTDRQPRIGRNVTYNPAYFGGDIDDVRIFSRALPCD